MRLLNGVLGLAATVSVVLPAVSANAQMMRDEDVIAYRQEIMKTMGAQSSAIGMVLAGMVPDKQLSTHFEILLVAVRQAKAAFEAKVPGGNALPVVWDKWPDFSAKLAEAEKNMALAVEITKKDGAGGQAAEAAVNALSCKGCHDIYKKP